MTLKAKIFSCKNMVNYHEGPHQIPTPGIPVSNHVIGNSLRKLVGPAPFIAIELLRKTPKILKISI